MTARVVAGSCGYLPPPHSLYWERFQPRGRRRPRPVLFIHGANQSGTCYRRRLDGGAGWVEAFTAAGYECFVIDWPGIGRSGYVAPQELGFDQVIDAVGHLVAHIGEVDLVGHSMGGLTALKLREYNPEHVRRVICVAPSPPPELTPQSEVLSDDGNVVVVNFSYTVSFTIDRSRMWRPTDEYIERQVIGPGWRLSRDHLNTLRATMQPIPPLMLLQRMKVVGDADLEIRRPQAFPGAQILVASGTHDPVHPKEVEARTVGFYRDLGADAELWWLGDRGIDGNGHLLMSENNSDEIVALLLSWLDA